MPCPISEFGAMIDTAPLGAMLMNAFGAKSPAVPGSVSANADAAPKRRYVPTSKTAAGERADLDERAAIDDRRRAIRRERVHDRPPFAGVAPRGELGGALDAGANADVRRAATQVAGHRAVDVGVGRMRVAFEQRRRGHDLAGLAIAALRHVELTPGLLQRMLSARVEALDRRDLRASDARDRRLTRARRRAVRDEWCTRRTRRCRSRISCRRGPTNRAAPRAAECPA